MALEQQQVNVQEIQRLNDAITITLDAIRRVAPQLAMLQQQQMLQQLSGFGGGMGQQQSPFGGIGQQFGGGMGQQFGGGMGQQQVPYHLLQQLFSQQVPFGMGGVGQYGAGGGMPWQQQYGMQQPWHQQQQFSPFGQRGF